MPCEVNIEYGVCRGDHSKYFTLSLSAVAGIECQVLLNKSKAIIYQDFAARGHVDSETSGSISF